MKNTTNALFLFLLAGLLTPVMSEASVLCNKLGSGVPQTWDCTESQQNSSVGYGWSIEPSYLGFFVLDHYDPGANPDYQRVMQCDAQEDLVFDVGEGAPPVVRQVRYDGTVKVVRQFGIYTPLSQSVTEASVYCDSPGPTMLSLNINLDGDGEGLHDFNDPLSEIGAIWSSGGFSFCGPSGPTDVTIGIGIIIISCRGPGGGG